LLQQICYVKDLETLQKTTPAGPLYIVCLGLLACPKSVLAAQTDASGDIQDPPGQGPVQPPVGDPALAGGLD